jgi:hypothetical protein
MSGFGILMIIFATCLLFAGLFMATGHKIGMLAWRAAFKSCTKEDWKNIGRWTIIVSIFIYIIGIIGIIFNFQ